MNKSILDHAKNILNAMDTLFSYEFRQNYADKSNDELLDIMMVTLEGLSDVEIEYGYQQMCKYHKLPNFGKFRKFCEDAGIWKSPLEAWNEALEYEKNKIDKIQLVTREVMIKNNNIFGSDYSFSARNCFIELYVKAVVEKRSVSTVPEIWLRPQRGKKEIVVEKDRVTMPVEIKNILKSAIKL